MNCVFLEKFKMSHRQLKALVNSEWLLFEKILRMGIGLLISAWTARFLGSDDYGQLRYAISFASLFIPFAEMGLSALSIREFVSADSLKSPVFKTLYTLKLFGGGLAVALCTLAASILHSENLFTRLLIGWISLGILFQAFDVIEFWFQSKLESKYAVIGKAAAFLISASIKVALLVAGAPLLAFAIIVMAESALNALLLVMVLRWKSGSGLTAGIATRDARRLLGLCYPLIFSGLLKILFLRIDQIMLSNLVDSRELGIYSVAVQIAEGFFFIPTVLHASIFPIVVEAKGESERSFYHQLQRFYNILALAGYVIVLAILVFSDGIIRLLFGPEFSRSAEMLRVLIWSTPFIHLGVARSAFLISMDMTKFHLFSMAGGCILNVLLNWTLIPHHGGLGAAVASIISYGFAGYFSSFCYRPLFKTGLMLSKAMVFPKPW
jgi:O-antigen/teichoic acid export membrane protein